jgi:hypothetical protein
MMDDGMGYDKTAAGQHKLSFRIERRFLSIGL